MGEDILHNTFIWVYIHVYSHVYIQKKMSPMQPSRVVLKCPVTLHLLYTKYRWWIDLLHFQSTTKLSSWIKSAFISIQWNFHINLSINTNNTNFYSSNKTPSCIKSALNKAEQTVKKGNLKQWKLPGRQKAKKSRIQNIMLLTWQTKISVI